MKKNSPEAKNENRQGERQSEMSSSEGGRVNRYLAIVIYIVVILVISALIYYLTRQNNSTFSIGL